MVGYSSARLLPLAWESPERCNLFGLLGNFQRYGVLRLGKFPNKLWYFPLANIRVPASILSFTTSSALASSVAASSVLPIGTKVSYTNNRSGLYVRDNCRRSPGCVRQTRLPAFGTLFSLPRHCQAGSGCARA